MYHNIELCCINIYCVGPFDAAGARDGRRPGARRLLRHPALYRAAPAARHQPRGAHKLYFNWLPAHVPFEKWFAPRAHKMQGLSLRAVACGEHSLSH